VVNMQWLVDMVRASVVYPASRYLVSRPTIEGSPRSTSPDGKEMTNSVNKGKERESDGMVDITNGEIVVYRWPFLLI
jgi:hypothetical protein